jgi:hypothetical protein
MIRRIGHRAGGDGGVDRHNTPPNPREGDFLLVLLLLFVGLPSLRGDALFGGPFSSSWQVASSSTSPTLDEAAPDVDVPPPLHSVVQAHPSMPDTRSSVFCSYSSHSNDCIGGMATTRQGGYRIAVLTFY